MSKYFIEIRDVVENWSHGETKANHLIDIREIQDLVLVGSNRTESNRSYKVLLKHSKEPLYITRDQYSMIYNKILEL
jgi:hypothetical protein